MGILRPQIAESPASSSMEEAPRSGGGGARAVVEVWAPRGVAVDGEGLTLPALRAALPSREGGALLFLAACLPQLR